MTRSEEARATLLKAFEVAVAAAHPDAFVPASRTVRDLREPEAGGRTVVLGAGKAAASMARALVRAWPLREPPSGLVVVRDGYALDAGPIEVIAAGHPRPDGRSVTAAERITGLARLLGPRDQTVVLLSGGASSLLAHPVEGVSLQEAATLFDALMHAGADIRALNAVRQHVTRLAGGGLAKAIAPARCAALVLSDVVGDDPAYIASGPLTPPVVSKAEALAIVARFGLEAPRSLAGVGDAQRRRKVRPGREAPTACVETIPADIWMAAVQDYLGAAGYVVEVVDPEADGDARALAERHANLAILRAHEGRRLALISGGEVTAQVRGCGKGGPNAEYALTLSVALKSHPAVHALACDTDGSDGSTAAAGALINPGTLVRAAAAGLDARVHLDRSDSGAFFEALGDQVVIGPTYTNVNDCRILLIEG